LNFSYASKKGMFFLFLRKKVFFFTKYSENCKKTIDKLPKRAYSANNKSIEKGENDENKN